MAERSPEFQMVRVEDRKTMEGTHRALPWGAKNCLSMISRMLSELRGPRSISMQQLSARMNERSFLA
jgi:hypothetical protein